MDIQQCKSFLMKLKDTMSLVNTNTTGLLSTWVSSTLFRPIRYKKWRVRYAPGRELIFNGKQKINHEIYYYRYDDEIFGMRYLTNHKKYSLFYIDEQIVSDRFSRLYYYFYHQWRNEHVFPGSSEEEKNVVYNGIKEDIELSLSINTDEDFNDLMRMVELMGIQTL